MNYELLATDNWRRNTSDKRRATSHEPRNTSDERRIMQNKPNLLDAQMNVSSVKTMNYEQITMNNANKNKPNQTQPVVSLSNLFPKSQNEIKLLFNKGL